MKVFFERHLRCITKFITSTTANIMQTSIAPPTERTRFELNHLQHESN